MFAIVDDMRFYPACNEGFRRLSLIAALVVGLLTFGWLARDHSHDLDSDHQICLHVYSDAEDTCYGAESGASSPEAKACLDKANREYHQCWEDWDKARGPLLLYWAGFAVAGLIGAYFATLCVRTVGWIAQGFSHA